jgi:hypothetical protein
MHRSIVVIFAPVFVFGCATEKDGLAVLEPDTSALGTRAPGRSRGDAGVAPDVIAAVDVILAIDTRPADVLTVDVLMADVLPAPDTRIPVDTTPVTDTLTLPDGLSYPHDIVPNTTTPCMQQVIDNGYASDKASCATWKIRMNADYIAQHPEYTGPRTSIEACKFMIDCFAAKPDVYTNWYTQPDCSCTCPIAILGAVDWAPLIDIVTPFCPTFFAM